MKHVFLLTALCAALSACSSGGSSPRSSAPFSGGVTYYQQVTPVAASGVISPIDTSRYSSMHIEQASYLFQ